MFGNWLLFYLVQTDRRFQHQEHIEALLTNVLDHFRDLFGLGNRIVDGFPKLLDEATKSLVKEIPPVVPLRARFFLPYF